MLMSSTARSCPVSSNWPTAREESGGPSHRSVFPFCTSQTVRFHDCISSITRAESVAESVIVDRCGGLGERISVFNPVSIWSHCAWVMAPALTERANCAAVLSYSSCRLTGLLRSSRTALKTSVNRGPSRCLVTASSKAAYFVQRQRRRRTLRNRAARQTSGSFIVRNFLPSHQVPNKCAHADFCMGNWINKVEGAVEHRLSTVTALQLEVHSATQGVQTGYSRTTVDARHRTPSRGLRSQAVGW